MTPCTSLIHSSREIQEKSQDSVFSLLNVSKTFVLENQTLPILKKVSLELTPGEIVGLVGQSGAGKSTLLQIAGLLEHASEGEILIEGRPTQGMSDYRRTLLRRQAIGFVYQNHRLLADFSALENVMLPLIIVGKSKKMAETQATHLLGRLGLSHRLNHRPAKLSGGEQQRVAIMRALANNPKVLLADEPTGNLDSATAEEVFQLLLSLVREQGVAALIATHNPELARRMDRVVSLKDGELSDFS